MFLRDAFEIVSYNRLRLDFHHLSGGGEFLSHRLTTSTFVKEQEVFMFTIAPVLLLMEGGLPLHELIPFGSLPLLTLHNDVD